jgi:cytochrome c oxidase subunit 4
MTTLAQDLPQAPQPPVGHVVPVRLLAGVFAALIFLTVVTVAVTYVDLGALSIWVALGIAVFKAALVALYFMHLRWDSPFHAMVLIAALFFVIIFIGISILDTHQNLDSLEPAPTLAK